MRGDLISGWVFNNAADVPQTGDENVRINLWLINGNAPTDNSEVEFIVKSFQFVPLGPPLPAVLTNFSRLPSGTVQFTINGQADRRYQVQSTTNFADWPTMATAFATNGLTQFIETNSTGRSRSFFRTVTLP